MNFAALALVLSQDSAAPSLTARDLHAAFLAVAPRAEIWPRFDPRRYTVLAPGDAAGEWALRFSSDPSVENPEVFMVVGEDYVRSHTAEEGFSIVFHEAFHAFQDDARRSGPKWRRENAALLAQGEADLRERARRFLALRALRQSEMEPRFVEFEKGLESNEGLAEYVGFRGAAATVRMAREGTLPLALGARSEEAFLAQFLGPLASIGDVGKNARRRFDLTGSAQGLLLDRLLSEWKRRVQENGDAVQDLLVEATGLDPASSARIATAALEEGGYPDALPAAEAAAARRQEEARALRDSVLAKGGIRLVLEVRGGGSLRSFDPMNVDLVGKGARVHTRMLEIGGPSNLRADFQRPVVEETGESTYTTSFEASEAVKVSVGGVPIDLGRPGERHGPGVLIEGPGLRVEADEATVVVREKEVLLRVGGG